MADGYNITYRLVLLNDRNVFGQTAATPLLAKLVPGDLPRTERLGLERTEWTLNHDKMKVQRSILIEAENKPGEWLLGA